MTAEATQPPQHATEPPTEQPAVPPWQWPEAKWRGIVNKVRAGRSLKPQRWKNGARVAVALSFDSTLR